MSTDKPPAWQTAVFTGSSRDNITPFLAYVEQQKKDDIFYDQYEFATTR